MPRAYSDRILSSKPVQCTLHNGFGQLLEYPVLTKQVFRFLVISQQSIDQVGLYYFAFGHRSSLWTAVSCLMTDYTKLFTPPNRYIHPLTCTFIQHVLQ